MWGFHGNHRWKPPSLHHHLISGAWEGNREVWAAVSATPAQNRAWDRGSKGAGWAGRKWERWLCTPLLGGPLLGTPQGLSARGGAEMVGRRKDPRPPDDGQTA